MPSDNIKEYLKLNDTITMINFLCRRQRENEISLKQFIEEYDKLHKRYEEQVKTINSMQ